MFSNYIKFYTKTNKLKRNLIEKKHFWFSFFYNERIKVFNTQNWRFLFCKNVNYLEFKKELTKHKFEELKKEEDKNMKLSYGSSNYSIKITNNAIQKICSLIKKKNNPNIGLKIRVESGGCHGFQYDLKIVDFNDFIKIDLKPKYLLFKSDDGNGQMANIIIDEMSLNILKNSKVDFVEKLIGSFFVVDSPSISSSCGCGTSFTLNMENFT